MAEANTVATPYTSNQGVSQDQLTNLASSIKSGYQGIPSLRESIANEVSSQEGMLKPLQDSKAAMIQQLFEHDKGYATQFGDKNSAQFIENPLARQAGSSAMTAPIWNSISSLSQDITSRRSLLGNTIANAVEAKKAELAGKQSELDTLMGLFKEQNAQKQFDASGNTIVDVGGKKIVVDRQGNLVKELGPADEKPADKKASLFQKLKSYVQAQKNAGVDEYTLIKDVMGKYAGQLSPDEIYQTYNSSTAPSNAAPSDLIKFGVAPSNIPGYAEDKAVAAEQKLQEKNDYNISKTVYQKTLTKPTKTDKGYFGGALLGAGQLWTYYDENGNPATASSQEEAQTKQKLASGIAAERLKQFGVDSAQGTVAPPDYFKPEKKTQSTNTLQSLMSPFS